MREQWPFSPQRAVFRAFLLFIAASFAPLLSAETTEPEQAAGDASPPADVEERGDSGVRVLLWRLVSLGVEPETSVRVEAVLGETISELVGFELLSTIEIEQARAGDPGLDECPTAVVCAASMGRALAADIVVVGILSILGEARSLELRRIDAITSEVVERISRTWTGDDDSLLAAIREATMSLLDPQALFGSLELSVNVDGVRVFLDGELLGTTPLKPLPLSPGRHTIKLVSADHHGFERFIDVPIGRAVSLEVTLESLTVEAFVDARPSIGGPSLALKGGIASNLGALHGPLLLIDGAWRLPFWGGRLRVGGELGARLAAPAFVTQRPSGEELLVRTRVLAFPLQAQLIYYPLPAYPFGPYLALGGGVAQVWQQQRSEALEAWDTQDLVPAFHLGLGLVYRLGPGDLLVEARFQHIRTGGVRPVAGSIEALMVTCGYMFTARRGGVR